MKLLPSQITDQFFNLNRIILSWITDKVLNLDKVPPSNYRRVPKSQQSFLSWITGEFLNLDEYVSLQIRIIDKFLNLNRIILSRITDKVLNLGNSPPLKYRRVPKSQQRSFLNWITGEFLNLDEDVSLQSNYWQVS